MVKLIDAETTDEVLTLRGRYHLLPSNHGFNPRVRFSPDGRGLFAVCSDSWEPLAVWSGVPDGPGEREARLGAARRRAVTRHLALANDHATRRGPARLIALDHLDHARRLGLDSSEAFVTWARILAGLDLGGPGDPALDLALNLAPDDDETLAGLAHTWASLGRFRGAGAWYSRMKRLPDRVFSAHWTPHPQALVLSGDLALFRRFCAEAVRRWEADPDPRWLPDKLPYDNSLVADSGIDAETRIRIARHAYEGALAVGDRSRQFWGLLALGAAHLRAGDPERAEPLLREVLGRTSDDQLRALVASWLSLTTRRQGRAAEAKTWFDQADRFLRERAPGGRPDREHRPPDGLDHLDWWRLLIAWGEARDLFLDDAFPARPFAPNRAGRTPRRRLRPSS